MVEKHLSHRTHLLVTLWLTTASILGVTGWTRPPAAAAGAPDYLPDAATKDSAEDVGTAEGRGERAEGRGSQNEDVGEDVGTASPPEDQVWTLEACLDAALRRSPEVVQKQLDAAIAAAKVAEASAARLPHFTWQTQVIGMTPFVDAIVLRAGTYGEISIPSMPDFGSSTYIPPPNITVFEGMPGKYITTGVQVQQPLYTSGKIVAAIRLARLNHQLVLRQLDETSYRTAYYVKQVYRGIQLGEASKTLLETMHAEMSQILEDTRAMSEQGLVSTADVLEAEAGLKQIEQELGNTTSKLVEARESLRLLVAADPDDAMAIEESMEMPMDDHLPPESELIASALERRPEMHTRQVQRDLAKTNIKFRKADRPFRPVLGVSVEYGARGDRWPGFETNWTMEWDDYYTAAAQLQINLYDGGESASRLRQARLQHQKAETGLEQTRAVIIREVRQARASVVSSVAAARAADARLAEHAEKYRNAKLGFQSGTLGRAEYLTDYMAWSQARTQQLLARFNLDQARLSLELATGALPRTPAEVHAYAGGTEETHPDDTAEHGGPERGDE